MNSDDRNHTVDALNAELAAWEGLKPYETRKVPVDPDSVADALDAWASFGPAGRRAFTTEEARTAAQLLREVTAERDDLAARLSALTTAIDPKFLHCWTPTTPWHAAPDSDTGVLPEPATLVTEHDNGTVTRSTVTRTSMREVYTPTDSPDAPTAEWLEGALRRSGEELEVMRAERDAAVARADEMQTWVNRWTATADRDRTRLLTAEAERDYAVASAEAAEAELSELRHQLDDR